MVLLAEPAVGFSDGQSIKGAIIFDMKQFVRVVLACKFYIVLNKFGSADGPLSHEQANRSLEDDASLAGEGSLRRGTEYPHDMNPAVYYSDHLN